MWSVMHVDPSRCPVCSALTVTKKPFKYRFRESDIHGWGCARCGIIFLHPQPTEEELKHLYSAEYFEGGDFRCGHEEGYSDPLTLERLADSSSLADIRSMTTGRRFLEVGCAGGAFLNAARSQGFVTRGVELSEDASRFAREKFGLDVFTGTLADARFPDRSFDIVFMGDVIEHLPDPIAAMREAKRLLERKGLLILALPSQTNTLASRLGFFVLGVLGRSITVQLPPYHLFEYRPRSLRFLLRMCGFEIVRLDQGILSPEEINLRGPALQRVAKKALQYPNVVLTRWLGWCGDRITVFASNPD